MSFISEFRQFAMRGNVVDLAIGVIMGGAFGKIVSSLVSDVVMPPLGIIVGGVNFSDLVVTLKEAQGTVPAVVLKYGAFIQSVFDFSIVALAIFLFIKAINKFQKTKEQESKPAPAVLTKEEVLLTEIRDLLKHR
jgi:large conductance mechanosensitive channel